jgi:hypothetical protein
MESSPELISLQQHLSKFRKLVQAARVTITSNDGHDHSHASALSKEKDEAAKVQRRCQALLDMCSAFSPELNLDDTIERMVKVTFKVFHADRVGLFLVDTARSELTLKVLIRVTAIY